MPSTYSPNLRIELIGNGEQSGTWGATTNTNLGTLIEDAISGYVSVSITSANQALTALNGVADQSRNMVINLTTTTTANFNVYIPPVEKVYIIRNASAYSATIFCSTVIGNTTAAGTGATIPAGRETFVFADGTNVAFAVDYAASLVLGSALPTASGGTGLTSFTSNGAVYATSSSALTTGTLPVSSGGTGVTSTTAYGVLVGGTTSTGAFQNAGVGTAGQVLTSNGASAVPSFQTIQQFASGTALLFAQTNAPTGWTKVTAYDQAALRIVSGTASSGGSVNFTSAFTSQTPSGSVSVSVNSGSLAVSSGSLAVNAGTLAVGSTTLTTAQIPSHTHDVNVVTGTAKAGGTAIGIVTNATTIGPLANSATATGGGGSHNHSLSGSPSLTGSPSLSGSPSVSSASFSGNAINLAVKYVDAIIATKD